MLNMEHEDLVLPSLQKLLPGTPTTSSLWWFQLDNETKSLHEKWLEITISIC